MIYRSRIPCNTTDKEKFEHICNLTTSLAGLRKGTLAFKSRKLKVHLPRVVAANIGLVNKIHHRIISDVLKRHRCSIYHYESIHSSNYTSWREYRKMFNLVYRAFEDIEEVKPVFADSEGMKRYLLEFVEESKPYQVELLITSGVVGCKIKTTFYKFSDVLKKLKFVLTSYRHSIDIQLK